MKVPEELVKYFVTMEKGCSSDSYVLMVRWGQKDNVWKKLKERCPKLEGLDGIFYRCELAGGRLTFYMRTGKLMVEPENKDVVSLLMEIFR